MSNFPCSLTRNITSHSMKNLAFHSFLRWKIIILPILTASLINFWENVLFELLRSERINPSYEELRPLLEDLSISYRYHVNKNRGTSGNRDELATEHENHSGRNCTRPPSGSGKIVRGPPANSSPFPRFASLPVLTDSWASSPFSRVFGGKNSSSPRAGALLRKHLDMRRRSVKIKLNTTIPSFRLLLRRMIVLPPYHAAW